MESNPNEICPECGLPADFCVCGSLDSQTMKITVKIDRRRWGKAMTVVEFQDAKDIDIRKLSKKAKGYFATGGTYKGNKIELQGNHQMKMKKFLVKQGFSRDNITIIN